MNVAEAGRVMACLTAIFWRDPIEAETASWWLAKLQELDNYDAAYSAAEGFGLNADRFPTMRGFMLAYRAENERLAPPAIEEGPRQKPPEWVLVWTWLRHNGDYRTLPQQPGWDLSSDRMSQAEYEQAAKEWLAETGGEGEAFAPSAKAL